MLADFAQVASGAKAALSEGREEAGQHLRSMLGNFLQRQAELVTKAELEAVQEALKRQESRISALEKLNKSPSSKKSTAK